MNETNISPRQRFILNIVNSLEEAGRIEIQEKLAKTHKVSKPTIIRDLDCLVKKRLIKVKGKGKNTKYFIYSKNYLLKKFDLDSYFSYDPDERIGAKKKFNMAVFSNLNNLFSFPEIKKINNIKKSYKTQTSRLDPDILKKELERFTIELSWKSSQIEGNTYTLLQTEELIKKDQAAVGKNKEETLMILNHKSAFEEILGNSRSFKELNFSRVNQLHNLLVKGLNVNTGIRKQAVGITGTVYKPLGNEFQIREVLEKLYAAVNKNPDVLERALIISFMIPYIQPYNDGNKRTARMLVNAILLSGDYYPLSYRSINQEEFKKALILFYEQNSIYHLKRLFIEQLLFAYHNYFVLKS